MKAALIPPRGLEMTALMSDIHLVLPLRELITNTDYVSAYTKARSRGDYVILDNGCAEAQLVDGLTLVKFATQIGAHEIVAPDVMDDAERTFELTRYFLKEYPDALDYNIMGVLQGEDMEQRATLARAFDKIDAITTLGIPKVHIRRAGSEMRHRIVEWVLEMFPGRFKIHLLGLSRHYPTEIRDQDFPSEVRSVDSALPYKLAEDGIRMAGRFVQHSKRRTSFFTKFAGVDQELLLQNIATFKQWAAHNES